MTNKPEVISYRCNLSVSKLLLLARIANRKSFVDERRWDRMKKTVSKKALAKEAAFWSDFSKAVKENPGKICHK